jgi:predicted DCC family thiol-disulfide oxidoreductase YuxK
MCVRWAERLRAFLEKHGFILLPLQSADVRAVLQVPEKELLAEMRVITASGRVVGGADALAHISRIVCKPVFWLTRIPGAMPLLRIGYRFVARNRGCGTNACHAPGSFRRRDLRCRRQRKMMRRSRLHRVFFEMP